MSAEQELTKQQQRELVRQINLGNNTASGIMAALGIDELPFTSDADYEAQEKINALYSEGENFHEQKSGEHDAACESDIIDAGNRADIMRGE